MDFVTFDIAKKLKEKGFKEKCYAYYFPANHELVYNTNQFRGGILYDCLRSYNSFPKEVVTSDFIGAPTITQVLKWLREEKKRFVVIHPEGHDVHYYYTVHNLARSFDVFEYTQSFATYEEAVLEGIEYVIDNLI